ncbi:hypothetical protein [Salinisphaera orenii]|uniref:hypothetical protein n=1 Tax=Salinisphaera orenii TaxID=856731 RepID=UPI0013A608DF
MPGTTNWTGSPVRQALWNMRLPAVFILGPLVGLFMVSLIFGLSGQLWLLGLGFFAFSCVLFGILVNGEIKRLRRGDPSR